MAAAPAPAGADPVLVGLVDRIAGVFVARRLQAQRRRQHQRTQHLEDLAVGARRLVLRLFGLRVAYQGAQLLAVGLRVVVKQGGQRLVTVGQQAVAPVFHAVHHRHFAAASLAVGVQRIADRVQRCLVLAAHVLGQERQLALVGDVGGDALALGDMRQQVFRDRQARQLGRGQRHQLLAQGQDVERVAPVLAAALVVEFTGFFVASAHRPYLISKKVARRDAGPNLYRIKH